MGQLRRLLPPDDPSAVRRAVDERACGEGWIAHLLLRPAAHCKRYDRADPPPPTPSGQARQKQHMLLAGVTEPKLEPLRFVLVLLSCWVSLLRWRLLLLQLPLARRRGTARDLEDEREAA